MKQSWPPFTDEEYFLQASELIGNKIELFNKIKVMVFDADGILTSGNLLYGFDGEQLKEFNAKDGLGLVLARVAGIRLALLTGRDSKIAATRAEELGFSAIKLGRFDKQAAMKEIFEELDCSSEEVMYMGDDLIDIPAMNLAALKITVPISPIEVKNKADYVTKADGGNGAVREVTDLILKSQKIYSNALIKLTEKAWIPVEDENG